MRAERAIGFPEEQDIGELRLNFIRLSSQVGAIGYTFIVLAPLAAGIACLWAITSRVFNLQETANIAASGTLDDLALAVSSVMATADFWLWFYLAFTIANTMFPSLRGRLSARGKSALAAALAALVLLAWRLGGEIDLAIAQNIENLVGSLALIMLQVVVINVVAVLILGAAEALIERASGKSATFTDGKMITMSREEAQDLRRIQAEKRRAAPEGRPAKTSAAIVTSIYDLKLPIPGPPGREPVSRSAAAVVSVVDGEAGVAPRDKSPAKPDSLPEQPRGELARPREARAIRRPDTDRPRADLGREPAGNKCSAPGRRVEQGRAPLAGEKAPFSRPFVDAAAPRARLDIPDETEEQSGEGTFSRPFSMNAETNEIPATENRLVGDKRAGKAPNPPSGHDPSRAGPNVRRTRPASKPSRRASPESPPSRGAESDELSYEPLDDDDFYPDDDEIYDDTPPSS